MTGLTYKASDGKVYPLREADYEASITVYRSDRRKATIGDPNSCLIAVSARRNPRVLDAYIGSGRDAYIVYAATEDGPAHAVHFTISATAGRVRDAFDTNKTLRHQIVMLGVPPKTRTLAARRKAGNEYRKAIREGRVEVKPSKTPRRSRMLRLGVSHRPSAKIERNTVSL